MHPQILLVLQVEQHRVRDFADAHLHGGAVRDQLRDVFGNALLQLARRPLRHLDDGVADRHDVGEPADMDEAITQGTRHLVVDLGDNGSGRLGRGLGQPHLDTEGAKAVLVGRRAVDHRHVRLEQVRIAQGVWDLAQEDRREVGAALVHRLAHVVTDEEGVDADVPLHLRRHILGRADGEHLDDLHILQLRGTAHQRAQQFFGHRAVAGHKDAVVRLDRLHRNIGRAQLIVVGDALHTTPSNDSRNAGWTMAPL